MKTRNSNQSKLKPIISLYKPQGLTPLEAIQSFKNQNPEYKDAKMSYAGRLDPLAKGILLIPINNNNKQIMKYIGLPKQYKAEILFNFSTDTYDVLGIPTKSKEQVPTIKQLRKTLKSMQGKQKQILPPYSSYIINQKPLFWYARNNKLPKELPTNNIEIKKIKINKLSYIKQSQLLKEIKKKIDSVNPKADFRQNKIKSAWTSLLNNQSIQKNKKYLILSLTIDCSSGTYIRQLANQLGESLKIKALLYTLTRTKIGKFTTKNAIRIKQS